MELREALDRVAEIRQRMAEAELFRGYRALPAAFAGILAGAAGWLQPLFVPDPVGECLDYVFFWGVVAALSLGASVAVMWLRDRLNRVHDINPATGTGVAP